MQGIFVSYRRQLAGGYAGHLRNSLCRVYRPEAISMDIEIEPGDDFERWIKQRIASCHVLLAIIAPGWSKATDEAGNLRLHNPRDYARMEIEAALTRGVPILPVFVGDTKMPPDSELPGTMAQFARLQGIEISDERWDFDVDRLVR